MKRLLVILLSLATTAATQVNTPRGVLLEELTWQQAERVLTPDRVIVIALGAEAKEHGPHLRLNNDWLMAEYFKRRILAASDVVVAPTINYSFYPAFVEYPGSTTLRLETARDMIVDVVHSLAHYGPRRFYILNTGVSTVRPLTQAQELLSKDGIDMRFTDLKRFEDIEKQVRTSGGTHADEVETSMMLYIAPQSVDMKKAVRDLHDNRPGPLSRDPKAGGTYSPTGTWGDPTTATREKGKIVVEGTTRAILKEIDDLRKTPVMSPAK
jgi:creatinine amidohydrolase